ASGFHGILNGVEDRQAQVLRAALAGRHAAHHLRAVGNRLFGVQRALRAGNSLADDPGVLVDQYAHGSQAPLTAATMRRAASSNPSAATMLRPLSASFFAPRSALLPSRRT